MRKALAEAGIRAALTTGTSPLEVILQVMRGGEEAANITERQYMAACAAAPYVHPRLNATHVSGVLPGILSHEERLARLDQLERDPLAIEGQAEPVEQDPEAA